MHNSAPININASVNVNNSSVPALVHNNFVNTTHAVDDGPIADPSSYLSPVKAPSYLKFRKLINRSQQKLSSNSCSMLRRTRHEKECLGEKINVVQKYPAVRYKVLDIELLQ